VHVTDPYRLPLLRPRHSARAGPDGQLCRYGPDGVEAGLSPLPGRVHRVAGRVVQPQFGVGPAQRLGQRDQDRMSGLGAVGGADHRLGDGDLAAAEPFGVAFVGDVVHGGDRAELVTEPVLDRFGVDRVPARPTVYIGDDQVDVADGFPGERAEQRHLTGGQGSPVRVGDPDGCLVTTGACRAQALDSATLPANTR
jgi:hypothetical protein